MRSEALTHCASKGLEPFPFLQQPPFSDYPAPDEDRIALFQGYLMAGNEAKVKELFRPVLEAAKHQLFRFERPLLEYATPEVLAVALEVADMESRFLSLRGCIFRNPHFGSFQLLLQRFPQYLSFEQLPASFKEIVAANNPALLDHIFASGKHPLSQRTLGALIRSSLCASWRPAEKVFAWVLARGLVWEAQEILPSLDFEEESHVPINRIVDLLEQHKLPFDLHLIFPFAFSADGPLLQRLVDAGLVVDEPLAHKIITTQFDENELAHYGILQVLLNCFPRPSPDLAAQLMSWPGVSHSQRLRLAKLVPETDVVFQVLSPPPLSSSSATPPSLPSSPFLHSLTALPRLSSRAAILR